MVSPVGLSNRCVLLVLALRLLTAPGLVLVVWYVFVFLILVLLGADGVPASGTQSTTKLSQLSPKITFNAFKNIQYNCL